MRVLLVVVFLTTLSECAIRKPLSDRKYKIADVHFSKRRDLGASTFSLEITIEGKEERINLKAKYILTEDFSIIQADYVDGSFNFSKVEMPNDVLYMVNGHAFTDEANDAALFVSHDGETKVEGMLDDYSKLSYVLEDDKPKGKRRRLKKPRYRVYPINRRRSFKKRRAGGSGPPSGKCYSSLAKSLIHGADIQNDETFNVGTDLTVEILVVVDDINYAQLEHQVDKTLGYIVSYWAKVDLIFWKLVLCPKIQLAVVGIIIMTHPAMAQIFGDKIKANDADATLDHDTILKQYHEWLTEHRDKQEFPKFDHSVLHFGRKISLNSIEQVSAECYGTMCSDSKSTNFYSVSLLHTEADTYEEVQAAAFTIGFALGAKVDEEEGNAGCKFSDGYIINYGFGQYHANQKRITFSECSQRSMEKIARSTRVNCLMNTPERYYPEQLVGSFMTLDRQCEAAVGFKGSKFVGILNYTVCEAISCTNGDTDSKDQCNDVKLYDQAEDGTPCGRNKICLQGTCTDYIFPEPHALCSKRYPESTPVDANTDDVCLLLKCKQDFFAPTKYVQHPYEGTPCNVKAGKICVNRKCKDPTKDISECSEEEVTLPCPYPESEGKAPQNCNDLLKKGITRSGPYTICPDPKFHTKPFDVYCDMQTDGGGWTVIQRRKKAPKHTNFTRTWDEYKAGFGELMSEFWLGNDYIHVLTNQEEVVLRVDLEAFDGSKAFGIFHLFNVDHADTDFNLSIGYFLGQETSVPGNSLAGHGGQIFVTHDRNDLHECSKILKGGWWYVGCYQSNVNGVYFNEKDAKPSNPDYRSGIRWLAWKGHTDPLKKTELKIRSKEK